MCSIFVDGKSLDLYENAHKPMIYNNSKQNEAKHFPPILFEHISVYEYVPLVVNTSQSFPRS